MGVEWPPSYSHTAAMALTAWAHIMLNIAASNMPKPGGRGEVQVVKVLLMWNSSSY